VSGGCGTGSKKYSIVIVVFSQLYPTRRKKVKADSEEEEGEGDQQQATFYFC
jgi:hypothetical protein